MPASQGGTISGSINLPAQSLFPTIPALYSLFKAAGASRIVWYCGMYSMFFYLQVCYPLSVNQDLLAAAVVAQQRGLQTISMIKLTQT